MTTKRTRLPKEGLADPRERAPGEGFIDLTNDVQGHGFPLPAPPADSLNHGTGHGGEALPTGDDEERHDR
jgi:hypothetical protein